VEAYAGSAAQLAALTYLNATGLYKDSKKHNLPTIIFLHALNPYGFYHNRRPNEDNVDLNRNFLTDEEFAFVRARDPNYSKYVELDGVLNPKKQPSPFVWLNDIYGLLQFIKCMVQYGFTNVKRAMVAGNYHKQDGYGFGGFQRSVSVNNLLKVLERETKQAKFFFVLDVHTGLGPTGVDTLMFDDIGEGDDSAEWIESVFPTEINSNGKIVGGIKSFAFGEQKKNVHTTLDKAARPKSTNKDAELVSSGYELTVGTTKSLCDNFAGAPLKGKHRLCLTQVR
jgi:hypothetical protein